MSSTSAPQREVPKLLNDSNLCHGKHEQDAKQVKQHGALDGLAYKLSGQIIS